MIDLTWSEIWQVSVEEDNIENYIEELIKEASPYNYSNGDIDCEDITELVTLREI